MVKKSTHKKVKKITSKQINSFKNFLSTGIKSFNDRFQYSYASFVAELVEIAAQNGGDKKYNYDILYSNCYRTLSHSIEMLSKEILFKQAPHLILEKLDIINSAGFNILKINEHNTCTCEKSFNRLTYFLKNPLTDEEFSRVRDIIHTRNKCEHSYFSIQDYDHEFQRLLSAGEIVKKIFNSQFRGKNLYKICAEIIGESNIEAMQKILRENTVAFKKVKLKVEKLAKSGIRFGQCQSCYYDFAKVNKEENEYTCLWCGDHRYKGNCSTFGCRQIVWYTSGEFRPKCELHSSDYLISWDPTPQLGWQYDQFNNPFGMIMGSANPFRESITGYEIDPSLYNAKNETSSAQIMEDPVLSNRKEK